MKHLEIKHTKLAQKEILSQKQSLIAWIVKTLNQKGEA